MDSLAQAQSYPGSAVRRATVMTLLLEECTEFVVLDVEGTLRAPVRRELRRNVEALLNRGERRILVNLARLTDIDAAGVGELLRAYHTTRAMGGVLQLAHARGHVRHLLDVTGIMARLGASVGDC